MGAETTATDGTTTDPTGSAATGSTTGSGTGSATDTPEPTPSEPDYGVVETCACDVRGESGGGWAMLGLLAAFGVRRRRTPG